ncbi:pinopsin-like [Bombina bombina]|uniref:pinopsin-like n=1 Tax=Bombina bombina TaxID=8345 RepID=UPI00235B29E3|nr:pinopsin-like [Bombina bombina]
MTQYNDINVEFNSLEIKPGKAAQYIEARGAAGVIKLICLYLIDTSVMMSDMKTNWTTNISFESSLSFIDNNVSEPKGSVMSRTGHTVVAVFLGTILVFGFLNNFIVLILFCKFKTLRTPVNMMLLNISFSDMLVCVTGTTLSFTSSIQGQWIGGEHGCQWYGFVNSCFGIVSLTSLAILSYERYTTLTLYNKNGPDFKKALLAVGSTWVYSLLWTCPPLLGWSRYGLEGARTSCSVRWTSESRESVSYIICLFIFCLVIPVLVMVYCYARLLKIIRGVVGKIRKTAVRKREYHVLFMVITTVICYLICWMPYGVVALMATFGRPGTVTPVASVIPSILAKSSTVFNPLIYILMNKQVNILDCSNLLCGEFPLWRGVLSLRIWAPAAIRGVAEKIEEAQSNLQEEDLATSNVLAASNVLQALLPTYMEDTIAVPLLSHLVILLLMLFLVNGRTLTGLLLCSLALRRICTMQNRNLPQSGKKVEILILMGES